MNDPRDPSSHVIRTERLTLRPPCADDLDGLYALHNDPEVMRHLTGGAPIPRERVRDADLPRMAAPLPELGGAPGYRIAEERDTGAFLGWFQLCTARRPSGAGHGLELELGYRLPREVWGRGLAAEGSRALLDVAFGDLGADLVYAEAMAVNTASRRVMEKAGLVYAGTFHLDWQDPLPGAEHGAVRYEMGAAAWKAIEATGL